MDKVTLITFVSTAITLVGFFYGFMRNFKTDVNSHIDAIIKEMKEERQQRQEENKKMDQRIFETNKRMDGVYHILLKRTENL